MNFDPGFDIKATTAPLDFQYGQDVFGPVPELRSLDSIRPSLRDQGCAGPDPVYAIAMDVGDKKDRVELTERMLLFGTVTYAAGRLGQEPVRSQGHVHRVSQHSGWSPPEIYEIWQGEAFVYMQEYAADDPGRCFAIHARPGDIVLVPPGWAHATISADAKQALTFGALCDREYGFLYDEVRRRQGLAWYATLDRKTERLEWTRNIHYRTTELDVRPPGDYSEVGIQRHRPLYQQFQDGPHRFQWVSQAGLIADYWKTFSP